LEAIDLGTDLFTATRIADPLGETKISMHMKEGCAIIAFWVEGILILTRKLKDVMIKTEDERDELRINFAPREIFAALKAGNRTSQILQVLSVDVLTTDNDQLRVEIIISHFHWVNFKPQGRVFVEYNLITDSFTIDFGNMNMSSTDDTPQPSTKVSNPITLNNEEQKKSIPPPQKLMDSSSLIPKLLECIQTSNFEALEGIKTELLSTMTQEEIIRLVSPFVSSPLVLTMLKNFLQQ